MSVSVEALKLEREEWLRQMSLHAEEWVHARAGGSPETVLEALSAKMKHADRQARRLERRIRRRSRQNRPLLNGG